MAVRIVTTDLHVLNMHTRMPFRYGIAELTALPHLFVRLLLQVDGKEQWGIAAEGLPPKWFTKNPQTHFKDDLDEMLMVIQQACASAEHIREAATVFHFVMQLYWLQHEWGKEQNLPPLLSNLGTSLVERALIDGFCRAKGISFSNAVRGDELGVDLGLLNTELEGVHPATLLPKVPLRTVAVRHTVGFGDPLTDADIPAHERLDDGLPRSLAASIQTYGLTRFKIKINGDSEADMDRLHRIGAVLAKLAVPDYGFTLDGNEQFTSVDNFRAFWQNFVQAKDETVRTMVRHLLFVEQPFHRNIALTPEVGAQLHNWDDRPPIIIDESDGDIASLAAAFILGYAGTSHKNCKGVFKGLASACLIAQKQSADPRGTYIMSGEDLANVGPVALLQDLAVMATLGIAHVERNGHHYFKGLSTLPADVQKEVVEHHGDLYHMHERGFPTLTIHHGTIEIGSVVDAPFGAALTVDPGQFTPLDQWAFASL